MLKAKVNIPTIDMKKTEDALHKVMSEAVLNAAKKWVLDVTSSVPVWSGASKASFLKLAFEVQVGLAIAPKVTSRIPLGIATSTGALILEKGKHYGWEWSSDLDYIHIVDQNNEFLRAGQRALKSINLPTIPVVFVNGTRK